MPAPYEVALPEWDELLIGDAARTPQTFTDLAAVHPGLDDDEAGKIAEVAAAVVTADLTSQGRQEWPEYWPPQATTGIAAPVRCENLSVLAVSSTPFDVTGPAGRASAWVKSLVAYSGNCAQASYTTASPGVEYVYLRRTQQSYTPVRDWSIPQRDAAVPDGPGDLPDWQLTEVGPCGISDETQYRLRTLTTDAFRVMCDAAAADGVVLVVASAYRTRAEQTALFREAVEYYETEDAAREWVAYADDSTCESKHCAGTAVNIEPDNQALNWLNAVVRCAGVAADGTTTYVDPPVVTNAPTCPEATTAVRRANTYGFVSPVPRIPGYLEFVLPTGDDPAPVPDCTPAGIGVDQMVASVFRCRLARAAVPPAQVEQVVAEALVVSRCSSGWNPTAQVFAGRYADTANPEDGRTYTEAGVFALRVELAEDDWIDGNVFDAVVNINAAASLWLATRGWEQFACATGTDPGLTAGPALPAYGGPAIPAWATQY